MRTKSEQAAHQTSASTPLLEEIEKEHVLLEKRYHKHLRKNPDLNRTLVSFQANKHEAGYRWYKFKEGYSSSLVSYYLNSLGIHSGNLLDPFAGSGTSLFTGKNHNLNTHGIELLPIGYEVMQVRKIIESLKKEKVIDGINDWVLNRPWERERSKEKLSHIKITLGAFPPETEESIGKYLAAIKKLKDAKMQRILRFALLCILEEVSYTRKDGQYLRWDARSGRNPDSTFNKGKIKSFNEAIVSKLAEISTDLLGVSGSLFPSPKPSAGGEVNLIQGSCLDEVAKMPSASFDVLLTSPPYCNRYDYTRTYALELMLLGVGEAEIRSLRQTMLTCTVENREKADLQSKFSKKTYANSLQSFDSQRYLAKALAYLGIMAEEDKLNNPGIVRMIKNYFFEMSLLIHESARVMKRGAHFIMVNDNVRYAGIHIPVDLILSDFASSAGLTVQEIQVLPRGKGNSSQQMGAHGRTEVRKCVYIWQKL